MHNVQRIVDERDSYLESIIELQQDKDYLSFKLNNYLSLNTNCAPGSIGEASLKQSNNNANSSIPTCNGNTTSNHANNSPNNASNAPNSNSPNAANLNVNIGNCVTNNTSMSGGNLVDLTAKEASSLVELSDPQTLLVLIESIYKEIASANTIIESAASLKSGSDLLMNISNEHSDKNGEGVDVIDANLAEKLNGMSLESGGHHNSSQLLCELKSKKLLANNWNQKIAIELVECKVKLRQLINEM